MLYLKEVCVDEGGNKTGKYVTYLLEVDRVARKTWNPIYAGNVKNAGEHSKNFIKTYGADQVNSFLFEPLMPTVVKDKDPEMMFQLFVHTKHNSGGLDGWTPADLTFVSRHSCTPLCLMLDKMEACTYAMA